MARPVVLVYQEYAATTVTPETPDLNCLLSGPCYWIKDYLDDKGDQASGGIQVSVDYGTKNAANPYTPPLPNTDAITVAEPPSNKIGALLDATSVKIYFDECRVNVGKDVGVGLTVATSVPHNQVTVPALSTLVLADIKIGDYLIIQDPASPGVAPDLVKRIQSIDIPNRYIYTTTNFTTALTGLKARVEREVNNILIDSSFVVITGNTVRIEGGVTTLLTGELTARAVDYAKVYMQYRSLRQDLGYLDTVSSETDITTKLGKVDARNPLAGCALTALANTITPIQFFGVLSDDVSGHQNCLDMIGGRKDVYATVPLTVDKSIIAIYNTQYTQLASVNNAETTGVPQKFRVVLGAQTLPLTSVVSPMIQPTGAGGMSYIDGMHKTVDGPLSGTPILTADTIDVFVDPAGLFLTNGVRAGDTLVIVDDTVATRKGTYTVAQVYDNTRLRVTTPFTSTNKQSGTAKYYIIRDTGTPVSGTTCIAGVATTGPNLFTADAGIVGLAAHVGKVLRITGGLSAADNGDWLVTTSPVVTPARWTPIASTQNPPVGAWTATTALIGSLYAPIVSVPAGTAITTRRCFRVIKSITAAHLSNLVRAGDAFEIPNPVAATAFTAVFSHAVAYIPNENDIVLATGEDAEATDPANGDLTLRFRINRTLTKDDQVLELVSIAQSFSSRRTVLVWPDSVLVASLVDGSKPRAVASVPELADPQLGYYLAAVVGGLTAGLPSHQGFTNLGIAGISQVYHSTRYFSDEQLTHLSDGGWFLFVQDTPSALPVCLHQLTTDPDTLETGEYSCVKNFDFISLFFMDILYSFIGQYNVTVETIGQLHQGLQSGIDLLKLRKYARIGAPLTEGTIASVAQSTAAADRVEAYILVQMPKPLNRVGLHLVSV